MRDDRSGANLAGTNPWSIVLEPEDISGNGETPDPDPNPDTNPDPNDPGGLGTVEVNGSSTPDPGTIPDDPSDLTGITYYPGYEGGYTMSEGGEGYSNPVIGDPLGPAPVNSWWPLFLGGDLLAGVAEGVGLTAYALGLIGISGKAIIPVLGLYAQQGLGAAIMIGGDMGYGLVEAGQTGE
jgi:hypothetical protein